MKKVQQIKSRSRVVQHGEVFTAQREVNAMLDLVKSETERIESRFLEPACGEGSFLIEILRRKLSVVNKQYGKFPPDFEKFSIIALMSIYGVDILLDNVVICREKLFNIWDAEYRSQCRRRINEDCRKTALYVLEHNILCGDALTMKRSDGTPIIFAQWDFVFGNMIKRRDYCLDRLLVEEEKTISNQKSIFDLYDEQFDFDLETQEKVPRPIKEYPPIDYRRIFEL